MNAKVIQFNADDLLDMGDVVPLEITLANGEVGRVYHRGLPAGDILDFVEMKEGPDRNEMLMRLVARAICHDDGSAMFSEDHLERLRDMPVKVFSQMAEAVTNAAGITKGEDEEGNA